ncbi:nuclear factor erythroid 2-related factor 3 [Synchiropus splendidus]|uniref:nuclear factor erythroid 2-related factor 3 n=1 Tax=Synchiropus splendidus TaxID=270530 RepID=UPI00237D51E0|nr:nuclear factor erythroid 2-related factor 3 [Synchiropus splendidus]
MQVVKKHLKEVLCQLAILLSLIGARVDIDSYFRGDSSPLIEIHLGPSSAHSLPYNLRDFLDGHAVHPKCPELDYLFASRRLLEEVKTLGTPRFPTHFNAWLVHQVSASDKADCEEASTSDSTDTSPGSDHTGSSTGGDEHLLANGQEQHQAGQSGACQFVKVKNEDGAEDTDPTQLVHSSTLEETDPEGQFPQQSRSDLDRHMNHLLPWSATEFENFLLESRSDLDISGSFSHDISLRDAMFSSSGLASLHPGASVRSAQGRTGGMLDEAVFDQINQLDMDMDYQLMHGLQDLDQDSGLSLESSSGGPFSPGSPDMSSDTSWDSECGATGCSSEENSLLDYSTLWSHHELSENVRHDHTYSAGCYNTPTGSLSPKHIKEEPFDEEYEPCAADEAESRDELRARAMGIPFSVQHIVDMPVKEFLHMIESCSFSSDQVTLLRDIRRRGKNKLAVQNCRKRKIDVISGLQQEVEKLQAHRAKLLTERHRTTKTIGAVGQQIEQLTRHILAQLRDESGQPLTPDRFTLQCRSSGGIVVQRRRPAVTTSADSKTDKRKKEKKQ